MKRGKSARRREADLSGALLSAPDKLLPPESCFCICHIWCATFLVFYFFESLKITQTLCRSLCVSGTCVKLSENFKALFQRCLEAEGSRGKQREADGSRGKQSEAEGSRSRGKQKEAEGSRGKQKEAEGSRGREAERSKNCWQEVFVCTGLAIFCLKDFTYSVSVYTHGHV